VLLGPSYRLRRLRFAWASSLPKLPTSVMSCSGEGLPAVFHSSVVGAATPLFDPHYRVLQVRVVWVAPTSLDRPCPRSYACSRVPTSNGPMRRFPW
jgi:hypothetical protein